MTSLFCKLDAVGLSYRFGVVHINWNLKVLPEFFPIFKFFFLFINVWTRSDLNSFLWNTEEIGRKNKNKLNLSLSTWPLSLINILDWWNIKNWNKV